MSDPDPRRTRAAALHLHGLLAHWPEVTAADWVASLLTWEEQERHRRSLERRLNEARIGRFKPLCDFDWTWPKRCDRAAVEALMALDFLKEAANVVLVGPNGVNRHAKGTPYRRAKGTPARRLVPVVHRGDPRAA